MLACWCAEEQARRKQGPLVVVMEDWVDVPEARRGRCASEPAGSAQEKALAAGQTHLSTHKVEAQDKDFNQKYTNAYVNKCDKNTHTWLHGCTMSIPLTAEL